MEWATSFFVSGRKEGAQVVAEAYERGMAAHAHDHGAGLGLVAELCEMPSADKQALGQMAQADVMRAVHEARQARGAAGGAAAAFQRKVEDALVELYHQCREDRALPQNALRGEVARRVWVRRLIDRTRRNRLLYFPAPEEEARGSFVDLSAAPAAEVQRLLRGERVRAGQLLGAAAQKKLPALKRAAAENLHNRGLYTLFLSKGLARWSNSEGQQFNAPILMVPVLIGAAGRGGSELQIERSVVCALEGWALWGSGGVFGALYWRGGGSGGGEAASCSAAFANSAFAEAAKMFYYSKYVEWMDTAWIVLGGKRPGFLHLFHHIGTHQDPSLHACCRSLKAVLAAHPAVRALPRRRAAGDLPFPAAQLERRRRR